MVHLVCLFMKTHLQDNCLGCFLVQVVWMREEYHSVFPTPTEADKIGRFRRYIAKTQISADYIALSLIGINAAARCQAKFLIYCCLSVILLLGVNE